MTAAGELDPIARATAAPPAAAGGGHTPDAGTPHVPPGPMYVDVERCFTDLRIEDLADDARVIIYAVLDPVQQELFEHGATAEERARYAAVVAAATGDLLLRSKGEWTALVDEAGALWRAAMQTVEHGGHPRLAAARAAQHTLERLEALVASDEAAYAAHYAAAVRDVLTERGVSGEFEVVLSAEHDNVEEVPAGVHDAAIARTPLPMTGELPDWSDGTPADAVRRAGRSYMERLAR